MLAAPMAMFEAEVERFPLPKVRFHFRGNTNSGPEEAWLADCGELRAAMAKDSRSPEEKGSVIEDYEAERKLLMAYATSIQDWKESLLYASGEKEIARPQPSGIILPTRLPSEFVKYFAGSLAWNMGRTNGARQEFEAILELPEKERHYRSTWAAYMLGKSWMREDAERALGYFKQVRVLVETGFADSIELAASTYGWEGYTELHRQHFAQAIEHYLEALAANDGSAGISLRMTVASMLKPENMHHLAGLAAFRPAQRVITAHLISRFSSWRIEERGEGDEAGHGAPAAAIWLDALEAADVHDVELAEEMALACYQNGRMETAQKWLGRAPARSAVVQWLQAKLFLRAGKVDQAARLLAAVAGYFPLNRTEGMPPAKLIETLVPDDNSTGLRVPLARQVFSELGVLQLTRREYSEALKTLLVGGWPTDAAYVAERVLSLEELAAFVNQNFPAVDDESDQAIPSKTQLEEKDRDHAAMTRAEQKKWIRSSLARRYARSFNFLAAFEYGEGQEQADYRQLNRWWETGRDESNRPEERAAAFWNAAKLTEQRGESLFGTDIRKYWSEWRIMHHLESDSLIRQVLGTNTTVCPSADEMRRVAENAPGSNSSSRRFIAADLAWNAAVLMPNGTDETARVLHTGGTWIKYLDPKRADIFYKALVRRCRKTELGHTSDLKRWFVQVGEKGQVEYPVIRRNRVVVAGPGSETLPEPVEPVEVPQSHEPQVEAPQIGEQ